MAADELTPAYFRLFNEIGIINQLATTLLESSLPDGLLAPHFTVLNHLVRLGDGRTPLEMANAFQIPKTTMSHQISVLEKRNLVFQEPNPRDGRSKRVRLTDAGRELRERIIRDFGETFAHGSAAIALEEVGDLVPKLAKIRRYLDEARDQERGK